MPNFSDTHIAPIGERKYSFKRKIKNKHIKKNDDKN